MENRISSERIVPERFFSSSSSLKLNQKCFPAVFLQNQYFRKNKFRYRESFPERPTAQSWNWKTIPGWLQLGSETEKQFQATSNAGNGTGKPIHFQV